MQIMQTSVSRALLVAAALATLDPGLVAQEAKHPRTYQRDNQNCPPEGKASSYHWDDGKGNDLTVDVYCVKGSFFSTTVTQSKNKKEVVVVSPTPVPNQELKPISAGDC
jgi:hypothetical protein